MFKHDGNADLAKVEAYLKTLNVELTRKPTDEEIMEIQEVQEIDHLQELLVTQKDKLDDPTTSQSAQEQVIKIANNLVIKCAFVEGLITDPTEKKGLEDLRENLQKDINEARNMPFAVSNSRASVGGFAAKIREKLGKVIETAGKVGSFLLKTLCGALFAVGVVATLPVFGLANAIASAEKSGNGLFSKARDAMWNAGVAVTEKIIGVNFDIH